MRAKNKSDLVPSAQEVAREKRLGERVKALQQREKYRAEMRNRFADQSKKDEDRRLQQRRTREKQTAEYLAKRQRSEHKNTSLNSFIELDASRRQWDNGRRQAIEQKIELRLREISLAEEEKGRRLEKLLGSRRDRLKQESAKWEHKISSIKDEQERKVQRTLGSLIPKLLRKVLPRSKSGPRSREHGKN